MREGLQRLKTGLQRFCHSLIAVIVSLIAAISFTGCTSFFIATAGVVTGYAFSRDSVVLNLDRKPEEVWRVCVEEVKRQGRIKREDKGSGRLEAVIDRTDVVVRIETLTQATVRVTIRARRHLLPKVDVAQRLAVAVAQRLG